MGATYRQEGCAIDYTPSAAKTAGDVVVQNGLVGVVKTDIAANALGSLTIDGVFRFAKATSAGNAMAVGQIVYYDVANDRVSTDGSVGVPAGKVMVAAALADTTVDVAINETDGNSQLAGVAVAESATVTASTTETIFSTGALSIPANSLRVGDVIRIRARGVVTNQNSTDTLTVRVRLGGVAGTAVFASAATDPATNDLFYIDGDIVVRAIGSSGEIVAGGVVGIGVPGTGTTRVAGLTSTTVSTAASLDFSITAQWSVNNASNVVSLSMANWEILRRN